MTGRRLTHDASATTRTAGGVVLLLVTGMLGMAVVNDIRTINAAPTPGHVLEMFLPSDDTPQQTADLLNAIHDTPTALRVPFNPDDSSDGALTVITCADLAHFTGPLATDDRLGCRDDAVYSLIGSNQQQGIPSRYQRLLPASPIPASAAGIDVGALAGTTLIVTQPPQRWAAQAADGTLIAQPGHGDAVSERFTTSVLSALPLTGVFYTDVDTSSIYLVRAAEHLVISCTLLGFLVAVATFLIAAADRSRERRREVAALLAVGTPRMTLALTDLGQTLSSFALATLLGTGIGWLVGNAYLTIGGHHGLFLDGIGFALALSVTAALIATAISPLTARPQLQPELLRRD